MHDIFRRTSAGILTIVLISTIALGGNGKNISPVPQKTQQNTVKEQAEFLPNMVVVKFKSRVSFGEEAVSTGIASVDQHFNRYGVTIMKQFFDGNLLRPDMDRSVAIESIYNVFFSGETSPLEVAQALSADPNIEYAEPKYVYPLNDIPNDALYSSMSQFPHIQAPAAWDVVKGESGNVIIAIVDGGTDWDHQDLLGNIWNNTGEIPNNGIDDDNNGFIDDVRGWNFANNSNDPTGLPATPQSASHGTHTAGTAAAVTNNGTGVASISWNCTLMPVCVAHPTSDRLIAFGNEGILYATTNGADIINCSWGSVGNPSSLARDVINFAYNNGSLVVAAAGNDGVDNDLTPHYPSSYNHVLAVGATNKTNDIKAGFSQYGVSVDVFAPGVDIYSTTPNNGYQYLFWSGTSMASPLAAGLAGLVKTLKPNYTVDQLREQVRVTCDAIDGSNPSYTGKLGKGRINALRAVTDFSIPAIRLKDVSFTDSGGNGIINAGETIDVSLNFINYLASASNINITLSESDNNITVTSGNGSISSLNSGQEHPVTLQFTVAGGVPDGYILRFYVDVSSGSYSDRDFFTLTVNPPAFMNHNTGTVQTSITMEGNIGFTDSDGTPGVGFVHDGSNYLFEGGLMIGNAVTKVSDCVRGVNVQVQDEDFRAGAGEELAIVSPGQIANEEGSILLVDSTAANPLGITVLQETYADNRPEYQDFVIFKYTIVNNNSITLSNVYAGLYFDWDISTSFNDYTEYDASRKMGYAMNAASAATKIAATKLLTNSAGVSYRAIDNPVELYDGFSDSEKWNFLSGGIQTQSLSNVDISTLLSEGPLTIPAHSSVEVAFAVIGAASLSELQTSADKAQFFWENPTAIEPIDNAVVEGFDLKQNYPNPFNPVTNIGFRIAGRGFTELKIYDVLGREVKTLMSEELSPGTYEVQWDGRNNFGATVSSGVYIYRLTAGNTVLSRKMLLMQ